MRAESHPTIPGNEMRTVATKDPHSIADLENPKETRNHMYSFYSLRYCEGIRAIRHYCGLDLAWARSIAIASAKWASPYVCTVREAERPISLEIVSGGNSKDNKWRQ